MPDEIPWRQVDDFLGGMHAANVEAFVEKGVPWVPEVSLAPPPEAIASGAQAKK